MCVCVRVCVCVCMHVCMYLCVCLCVRMFVCVMYVSMYVCYRSSSRKLCTGRMSEGGIENLRGLGVLGPVHCDFHGLICGPPIRMCVCVRARVL